VLGSPGGAPAKAKGHRGVGAAASPEGASSGGDELSPRDAVIGVPDVGASSAGVTPRASGGDGGGDAAPPTAAQHDAWLPGLLRPLSARGPAGGGYEALRGSDGGSNGSSPTTSSAAASASLSPRSAAASPATSPRGAPRDAAALLRIALGAGGDAWKRRRLPRALSYRYCFLSVLAIAVAYGSREADVMWDLWCMPTSWFQLHSVWHIMAALVRPTAPPKR